MWLPRNMIDRRRRVANGRGRPGRNQSLVAWHEAGPVPDRDSAREATEVNRYKYCESDWHRRLRCPPAQGHGPGDCPPGATSNAGGLHVLCRLAHHSVTVTAVPVVTAVSQSRSRRFLLVSRRQPQCSPMPIARRLGTCTQPGNLDKEYVVQYAFQVITASGSGGCLPCANGQSLLRRAATCGPCYLRRREASSSGIVEK